MLSIHALQSGNYFNPKHVGAGIAPTSSKFSALRVNLPCAFRMMGTSSKYQRPQAAARLAPEGNDYVISLGEALFDCLADQLGVPKEEVKSWTPYPGGAPANVACAVSRLGVPSVFLGALGKDDLGQQFMQLLKDRGVDVSDVQLLDKPTRDVLVTRSLDGDREFSGFGKAATTEYADCFIDAAALPLDKIKGARVLVTGTLGLAYPKTAEAMRAAVAAAKAAPGGGCTVVADVNWRPVFWGDEKVARGLIQEYIQAADIIKVTEDEVEWLLGLDGDAALASPERVLELLPNAAGVLISAGERGSAYAFGGTVGKLSTSGHVPVFDVDVVDTTGAGDAYLSGFLYRLVTLGRQKLLGDPETVKEAVYFASACGAFTCKGAGAIASQPTLEQAEALKEEALSKMRET